MKRWLTVLLLLVVLAAPAIAAPRDDDPHANRRSVISRIVPLIKALEDITASWPKP